MKFDLHDDLEELQARLFLDTRKRLSKKEILELIFKIGLENYPMIVTHLQPHEHPLTEDVMKKVLSLTHDLGEGSEDLSERVDEIVYGGK